MGATNVLDSYLQHGFDDRLPKGLFCKIDEILCVGRLMTACSGIALNAYEQASLLSGRYYHTVYSNEMAAKLGIGRFVGEIVELAKAVTRSVRSY